MRTLCKPGKGSSPRTKSAGTLILDSGPQNFLLFKSPSPSLWYLLTQPEQTKIVTLVVLEALNLGVVSYVAANSQNNLMMEFLKAGVIAFINILPVLHFIHILSPPKYQNDWLDT